MQSLSRSGCALNKSLANLYLSPVGTDAIVTTSVNLQTVRWRKKRWDPPAKNKTFKFPVHPPLKPGLLDERLRLWCNYKTHSKSVKDFLTERYEKISDMSVAAQREAEEEAIHHAEMMEYNRLENERIAAIRQERLERELCERLEEVSLSKLKYKLKEEQMREDALRVLKETEEFASTLIPPEEFMTVLSNAYDNPTEFNFAIDVEGNMYPGRNTKPWEVSKESLKKLPGAVRQ